MMRADLLKTLTAIGLLALACTPALKHIGEAAIDKRAAAISPSENRALALAPRWDGSLREYARGMDSYLNDNFGLRGLGLKINTLLKRGLGEGAYSVVRGQEGWLFLNQPQMQQSFAGRGLITPRILEGWRAKTEAISAVAAAQDAPFVLAIVPDKLRIYPEYAPRQYGQPGARRLRRLLLQPSISGLPATQIVDIEPGLLAQKPSGLVYAKTDTHWTARGAFSAYQSLMQALNAQAQTSKKPEAQTQIWPVLSAARLSALEIKDKETDLRQILGDPSFPKESYTDIQMPLPVPPAVFSRQPSGAGDTTEIYQTVILTRTPPSGSPTAPQTLVIVGDSFADIISPFFTHSFTRVVRLHHREGTLAPEKIAEYQPDAVIFMPVERSIPSWQFTQP